MDHVSSSYSLNFSLLLRLNSLTLIRMLSTRLLILLLLRPLALLHRLIGQPTSTKIPGEPLLWQVMFLLVLLR